MNLRIATLLAAATCGAWAQDFAKDEIIFAIGRRKNPSGPIGIMSGSRNKFSRNGSTDCSESGPPS